MLRNGNEEAHIDVEGAGRRLCLICHTKRDFQLGSVSNGRPYRIIFLIGACHDTLLVPCYEHQVGMLFIGCATSYIIFPLELDNGPDYRRFLESVQVPEF